MQLYRLTAAMRVFFFSVTVCTRVSYLNDADTLSSLKATKHRLHSTDHFTLIKLLMPNSTNFLLFIYKVSFAEVIQTKTSCPHQRPIKFHESFQLQSVCISSKFCS